jgi:NhaP-type Na+/H+ and K+/H+ antiporter
MAESLGLSGIMALFFNGIVLSHYNAYNLSGESKRATEQIFATLATISETIVFLYMGMGVFTGKFSNWNFSFTTLAIIFCVIGRFLNIFPLSFLLNLGRRKTKSKISCKMQTVLWFAGLRGAIAYALAENMPGENKSTYVAGTLSICLITTVICGGFTERILYVTGMKEEPKSVVVDEDEVHEGEGDSLVTDSFEDDSLVIFASSSKEMVEVYKGMKNVAVQFDRSYLQVYFGGQKHDSYENDEFDVGDFELEEMSGESLLSSAGKVTKAMS